MTAESAAPPPSGGNLKYGILGLLLLLGAVGVIYLAMGDPEPESGSVAALTPDAGPLAIERPTNLGTDELLIPELEPDAGPLPDAGRRIRYVTRYVGGGGGGNWNCNGEINQSAASRVMSQHQLQFRNCYERQLKVNNSLEGRISLRMRVGRDGAVSAVQVGGSLRDNQVLSCVRGIARRLHFPSPSGGCATVAVPFNFTPQR